MQWNFAEELRYDSGIKMRKRCKSHKFVRMTRLSYDIKNLKHGRPLIDSKKREKKARNDLCFSVCDMGWTIKKCRIAFSALSRLPTKEIFLQWRL